MSSPVYRHELKFIISQHQYRMLQAKLQYAMVLDKNSLETREYLIRSMYFDDMYDTAYHEKSSGIQIRKKFRIRSYNYGRDFMRIECKMKDGEMIRKESVRITEEEFHLIQNNQLDCLLAKNNPVATDFYGVAKTRLLKPVVTIDYEREAYISDAGNVRITFDKNLRASSPREDFFSPECLTRQVFVEPVMILEVKYDHFLPTHIKNLVQAVHHKRVAASKYVMSRIHLNI